MTPMRREYISRIDGDIVTYDIRMRKTEYGGLCFKWALHTFEHLFATYARNSEISDKSYILGLWDAGLDSTY